MDMLLKIDRALRKIAVAAVILGAVLAIFKKKKTEVADDQDGFQTKEFDDIW